MSTNNQPVPEVPPPVVKGSSTFEGKTMMAALGAVGSATGAAFILEAIQSDGFKTTPVPVQIAFIAGCFLSGSAIAITSMVMRAREVSNARTSSAKVATAEVERDTATTQIKADVKRDEVKSEADLKLAEAAAVDGKWRDTALMQKGQLTAMQRELDALRKGTAAPPQAPFPPLPSAPAAPQG